jgi:hypothetical protein
MRALIGIDVSDSLTPMGLGPKLVLIAPLVGVGFLHLAASGWRHWKSGDKAAVGGRLVVAGAALGSFGAYVTSPFWDQIGWLHVNVRFAIPFIGLAIAAAFARMAPLAPSRLAALVAFGLVSDAFCLNLRFPDFRNVIHRSANRMAVYASEIEVHSSPHHVFVPAAAALDRLEGVDTVAVANSGWSEFSYLYVGGRLARRVLAIPVQDPSETWRYPDGDARARPDVLIWLRNLRAEGVDVLVVARWRPTDPWPIEAQWAEELHFEQLFEAERGRLFRVPELSISGEGR